LQKLKINKNFCFRGVEPYKGIPRYKNPTGHPFEKKYLIGRDLNQNPSMSASRYIIDISENFASYNFEMRQQLKPLKQFVATSRVSKYRFFSMIEHKNILLDSGTIIIASASFSFMGILSSKFHIVWAKYKGSMLKADLRYTNTTCFETFPFPIKL